MKERDRFDADDAEIAELLRSVGARDEPAPQMKVEVEAAVREAWLEVTTARRRRRTVIWAAAASVCALVVASAIGVQVSDHRGEQMATLARADGDVFVSDDGSQWRRLGKGQRIAVGDRIRSDVRVALQLDSGVSVRLDRGTSLEITHEDRLSLSNGALYVDSGPGGADGLQIDTFAGSVRHIGTQYQVRTRIDGIDVRVREGRVQVESGGASSVASAGEHLSISPQGLVMRFQVPPTDDVWRWAGDVAPVFTLENAPLSAFLDWVARETGRTLVYQSASARSIATSEILHGSIEGLAPDVALAAVLASTPLRRNETKPEVIEVGVASAD